MHRGKEFKEVIDLKKSKKILIAVLIILAALILPGLYCGLSIKHYTIADKRFSEGIRIALVTDLHSCRYGSEQQRLLDALYEQEPDVVLLGGDIYDDERPDDNTDIFLKGIKDKYPCYYVAGNHECWCSAQEHKAKMDKIEAYGIVRLRGDAQILTVGTQQIKICGVDDPDLFMVKNAYSDDEFSSFLQQMTKLKQETEDDTFTILLSHRPELYGDYQKYGFDLVLSGHAHGGQWRIPGILNGLFAPDQGLFPKRAGGLYDDMETPMIVSRGLARESTAVPRLYNPPELVIIDLAAPQ